MEPETKSFFRYPAIKIAIKNLEESRYVEENDQNPNYILINLTGEDQKIFRINVMATIVHKEMRGTITDVLIDDGTGKIVLRFFEENKTVLDLEIGDVILVVGRVRRYNMEKYVFPEIVKKNNPSWLKVRYLELQIKNKNYEENKIKASSQKIENNHPNRQEEQDVFNVSGNKTPGASETMFPHLFDATPPNGEMKKNNSAVANGGISKTNEGKKIIVINEEIEENDPLLPYQKLSRLIAELDKGDGVLIEDILEKSLLEKTEELLERMLENGDIFQNVPGRVRVL